MIYERNTITASETVVMPEITTDMFRQGMARLGAAVTIVTSDGPAGRVGFTASAVCSVTDAPPTLLVCLNRAASAYPSVIANGVVAVNALAPQHRDLANLFGGKTPMADRFAAADWSSASTGAPLLTDAVVSFDCRISESHDVGSHRVLFCRIVGISSSGSETALAYFNRSYHSLDTPASI